MIRPPSPPTTKAPRNVDCELHSCGSASRTKFAIDVTHGLAVDAVLEIVRAMADASHKTVSDPLVRMLSKLAQHAKQGTVEARPRPTRPSASRCAACSKDGRSRILIPT